MLASYLGAYLVAKLLSSWVFLASSIDRDRHKECCTYLMLEDENVKSTVCHSCLIVVRFFG